MVSCKSQLDKATDDVLVANVLSGRVAFGAGSMYPYRC